MLTLHERESCESPVGLVCDRGRMARMGNRFNARNERKSGRMHSSGHRSCVHDRGCARDSCSRTPGWIGQRSPGSRRLSRVCWAGLGNRGSSCAAPCRAAPQGTMEPPCQPRRIGARSTKVLLRRPACRTGERTCRSGPPELACRDGELPVARFWWSDIAGARLSVSTREPRKLQMREPGNLHSRGCCGTTLRSRHPRRVLGDTSRG
jgi:hypothetical protein